MVNEMFDSGNGPRGCGSETTLVSYLYGEMEGRERRSFESHLEDCDLCAEEIASFSSLRISLGAIKNEFSATESPSTSVPETPANRGWLEPLAAFFGPLGVRPAVGVAAFTLLLLVGAFAVSYLFTGVGTEEIAEDVPPVTEPLESDVPVSEPKTNELIAEEDVDEMSGSEQDTSASDNEVRQPQKVNVKRKSRGPASAPRRSIEQIAENTEPPTLSEAAAEDLDDDSLRLTDLFTETSED